MTREEFAKRIHWDSIIWVAGLVNVGAMLPQMWKIVETGNVKGLSLQMFLIYLFVQVSFSLQGYFRRDAMLKWCLGLSATVTGIVICLILHYR